MIALYLFKKPSYIPFFSGVLSGLRIEWCYGGVVEMREDTIYVYVFIIIFLCKLNICIIFFRKKKSVGRF